MMKVFLSYARAGKGNGEAVVLWQPMILDQDPPRQVDQSEAIG